MTNDKMPDRIYMEFSVINPGQIRQWNMTPFKGGTEYISKAKVDRLVKTLKQAKSAIKGREHTGFIDEALAEYGETE